MRLRARLLRILRNTALTLATLLLLAFALVQFQQHLLRHRAERLLADFHSIRLNQSTWQDAQRLMTRWGAWGHYDGQCTPADCSYSISLTEQGYKVNSALQELFDAHWPQHYSGQTFERTYFALGGRDAGLRVSFLVEDGSIRRSGVDLAIVVPLLKSEEYAYEMILKARANDHLRGAEREVPWILGDDAQLAQHPEYKIGRPSGCEGCLSAEVTFTPYVSPSDLTKLTAYNLACITAWHPCRTLADALPVAGPWHLYLQAETPSALGVNPELTNACEIPAFVLARDSPYIVAVDTLSTLTKHDQKDDKHPDGRPTEVATARLLGKLRGSAPISDGSILTVFPFNGYYDDPLYTAENLEKGKRYILFFDQPPSTAAEVAGPVIRLSQCGVMQDSPELRNQINLGLSRRDPLRHAGTSQNPLW